jgi:hypothetical protein
MPNQQARGRTPKRERGVGDSRDIIFPTSRASRNEAFKRAAGVSGLKGVRNREEALAAMDPNSRAIALGKTAVRRSQPIGQRNRYLWPGTRAHGSVSRTKALYINPNNPYR